MENKEKDVALDEKMSKEKLENLDTKWIDVILGKTDSVYITERFEEIKNADLEQQRQLLMDLEEYCWDLDKANALQDWRYLIELMKIKELKDLIYGLFGTIMQNNEKAQKLFLNFIDWNELFCDLQLNDQLIINKVIYCLCSVIPSHSETLEIFNSYNGFNKVLDLLFKDIEKQKIIYFLNKNSETVRPLLNNEHVLILKELENTEALLN